MDPLKMYFLLKMGIFHCYVSLPEGIDFVPGDTQSLLQFLQKEPLPLEGSRPEFAAVFFSSSSPAVLKCFVGNRTRYRHIVTTCVKLLWYFSHYLSRWILFVWILFVDASRFPEALEKTARLHKDFATRFRNSMRLVHGLVPMSSIFYYLSQRSLWTCVSTQRWRDIGVAHRGTASSVAGLLAAVLGRVLWQWLCTSHFQIKVTPQKRCRIRRWLPPNLAAQHTIYI